MTRAPHTIEFLFAELDRLRAQIAKLERESNERKDGDDCAMVARAILIQSESFLRAYAISIREDWPDTFAGTAEHDRKHSEAHDIDAVADHIRERIEKKHGVQQRWDVA